MTHNWFSVLVGSLVLCLGGPGLRSHEASYLKGSGGARGEARIGDDSSADIRIRGDGLKAGTSISVRIADAGGTLVEAFASIVESNGSFEVRARMGELPLGASSPADFAGRAVEVLSMEGSTVLLEGSFPKLAERSELGVGSGALKPPVGAPFIGASGRIRVKAREGRHEIQVKVRGLAEKAVYEVWIISAAGQAEPLGFLTTKGGGNGALEVDTEDGGSIPFGASGIAEIAGLKVQLTDGDGKVVLEGAVASFGENEVEAEFQVEVQFDLLRPENPPEKNIRGDVNLRTEAGKHRVRVRLDRATAGAAYMASIRRSDAATGETIGGLTADQDGKAELEKLGKDVLPLGAASISELQGAIVEVADSQGMMVLTGTVPAAPPPPPPPPKVERLDLVVILAQPDPAVIPAAHGKLEFEEEEDEHLIEVEVEDLVKGALYRLEIRDIEGVPELLIEQSAGADGNITKRIDFFGADRLPFGVPGFRSLDGFAIVLLDGEGREVLAGKVSIPRTGGGGALPEVVNFTIVGDYDTVFLRGDADRSSLIDLTDVILTLGVLFQSDAPPRCEDAMDANDDGGVDISDPIFTLLFLFAGDRSMPFPGIVVGGFDPTPDGLFCRS